MITRENLIFTNDTDHLFGQPLDNPEHPPILTCIFFQVRQKAGVEHARLLRGSRPLHPHPLPHHRHHRNGGMLAW